MEFYLTYLANYFASYFLINLDFLLPQIAQFDETIILPFFDFTTFGFLLLSIFSTLQTTR